MCACLCVRVCVCVLLTSFDSLRTVCGAMFSWACTERRCGLVEAIVRQQVERTGSGPRGHQSAEKVAKATSTQGTVRAKWPRGATCGVDRRGKYAMVLTVRHKQAEAGDGD